MKIGRFEAGKLLRGETKYIEEDHRGNQKRYIDIIISTDNQRKTCPFKIERHLKEKYCINRENITSNRNGFTVISDDTRQVDKLLQAHSIKEVPLSKNT